MPAQESKFYQLKRIMNRRPLLLRANFRCCWTPAKALVTRFSLAFFSVSSVVALSGCTTLSLTTEGVKSEVEDHRRGVYITGHEPTNETGAAYITHEDFDTIGLRRFDGEWLLSKHKPGMGPTVRYGAGAYVGPVDMNAIWLSPRSVLVIRPGKHYLGLVYFRRNSSFRLPGFVYSKDDARVEFVAEKGHAYRIEPNLVKDYEGRAFLWNPTIIDLDAKADLQGK